MKKPKQLREIEVSLLGCAGARLAYKPYDPEPTAS